MDNQFESKGKDQNIGQGDGAIGKQVNVTQHVTGNNNFVTGTGDIHLPPPPVIPRQLPDHRKELEWAERYFGQRLERISRRSSIRNFEKKNRSAR